MIATKTQAESDVDYLESIMSPAYARLMGFVAVLGEAYGLPPNQQKAVSGLDQDFPWWKDDAPRMKALVAELERRANR